MHDGTGRGFRSLTSLAKQRLLSVDELQSRGVAEVRILFPSSQRSLLCQLQVPWGGGPESLQIPFAQSTLKGRSLRTLLWLHSLASHSKPLVYCVRNTPIGVLRVLSGKYPSVSSLACMTTQGSSHEGPLLVGPLAGESRYHLPGDRSTIWVSRLTCLRVYDWGRCSLTWDLILFCLRIHLTPFTFFSPNFSLSGLVLRNDRLDLHFLRDRLSLPPAALATGAHPLLPFHPSF